MRNVRPPANSRWLYWAFFMGRGPKAGALPKLFLMNFLTHIMTKGACSTQPCWGESSLTLTHLAMA